MYADDTTIYFNLEDFSNIIKETDINNELEKVNTWLKLNKLSLDTQKTKLMLFHRKQKHIDEVSVIINGQRLKALHRLIFLALCSTKYIMEKPH